MGIAGTTFAYMLAVTLALVAPHAVFALTTSLKAAPWRPWPGALKDTNNLLVGAQVLSNLGSRWWVEVQQVGDLAVDPAEILRMSIPAEGVQLVQRKPVTAPENPSRCKAKP